MCCGKEVQRLAKRQTKRVAQNVTKMKNDYVRNLEEQESRRKAQKTRLYRRLAVLAGIVIISFGILTNLFFGQQKVLATKEEEKQILLADLTEKKKEQKLLEQQLEKLNDDEYIAKLARQKYFLSDEHEIIFSLPNKDEKTSAKEKEKE